jgi:predicted nucleotidyltransferase
MDVDVTVWVEEERIPTLIDRLGEHLHLLPEEPVAFVERTRVLAAETTEGIRIDIIFGQLPYEEQAIQRARTIDFGGVPVLICSPEDLIIHKIISERSQDREDVRGIIHRLGPLLDREYIEPILRGLEEDLGRADLVTFFADCLER